MLQSVARVGERVFFEPGRPDPGLLSAALKAAQDPIHIKDLDGVLGKKDSRPDHVRAAVAWLLKYGLLERILEM